MYQNQFLIHFQAMCFWTVFNGIAKVEQHRMKSGSIEKNVAPEWIRNTFITIQHVENVSLRKLCENYSK